MFLVQNTARTKSAKFWLTHEETERNITSINRHKSYKCTNKESKFIFSDQTNNHMNAQYIEMYENQRINCNELTVEYLPEGGGVEGGVLSLTAERRTDLSSAK